MADQSDRHAFFLPARMTAELYRGRSKTSRFQLEGEMVSRFNSGNRIGTGKRACVYRHSFTWTKSPLSVHLSHAPAGRTVKRPLLEKLSKRARFSLRRKRPVLEIEDVNTMGFVKPKGRDSKES